MCFLTNPKSGDYQRLPDLQEHSYCVADRPYTSTTYPDIYERGEEPVYYISQDNHLMSKGELTNPDEEWQDLGQLTEAALTKENFDDCFRDDKSTGWEHVKTAAKIRENNEKAWSLLYDYDPNEKTTPILYYVLQQKNGEVYLAYGYNREPLTTMLFAGCLNLQHCQWRSCRRITLWRML